MKLFGGALIIFAFVMILFLSVNAIIRGYKGIKMSKCFEDKKVKVVYWLVSLLHMLGGVVITGCYLVSWVFILISL